LNFLNFKARANHRGWRIFLSLLVAVFYFIATLPTFAAIGMFLNIGIFAFQLASSFFLGCLFTLAAFLLPDGLRAAANGLCIFLLAMLIWAGYAQWEAQIAAGFTGKWIYLFYYDRPMSVLAVAMSSILLVCLVRALIPQKRLDKAIVGQFESYFRTASIGFMVFYAFMLLYAFLFTRQLLPGYMTPNWIPFSMIATYFSEIGPNSGAAYEFTMYFFGNLLLFAPLGFFLHGFFRRKVWLSIAVPALFSLVMELVQWRFRWGHCDVDDMILNTIGAALGVFAVRVFGLIRGRVSGGEEKSIFAHSREIC
jgi:glycopeptide antibiotics resistance protein